MTGEFIVFPHILISSSRQCSLNAYCAQCNAYMYLAFVCKEQVADVNVRVQGRCIVWTVISIGIIKNVCDVTVSCSQYKDRSRDDAGCDCL